MSSVQFDSDLIRRYDLTGPRYTSYPTAVAFSPTFTADDYCQYARLSNEAPIPLPLSLYVHIPFCDTVCFYCACNKIATKDHARAETYLQYLFKEIEIQSALFDKDRRVEQLHLGGGTPTFLNNQEMAALMAKLRQHFNLYDDDRGDYSIEIDPRSVTAEDIGALRALGFNRFSLGVQDVDERVQIAVNRIQPLSQTRAIIEACKQHDAQSINVDLIYGLPYQSVDSFMKTLEQTVALAPDRLSVFNYAHLPEMFKPQRRISESALPSADVKLEILDKAIQYLLAAGYEYIGMDHFAKPDDELAIAQRNGTLQRNFQGYTTHADCDLVAMGVSAISFVEGAYSQNAKTTNDYYQALDKKRLPVMRGLVRTDDDQIRAAVIHQLICQFELDFDDIAKRFDIVFSEYFAAELVALKKLAVDGLLMMSEAGIRVSVKGRLLIRSICQVFDVGMRASALSKQAEPRFSKVI